METIIAALIAAGASLLVCIVTNHYQSGKIQAMLEYRMDILEKKQDKYNDVVRRTYQLEQDTAVQAEQIGTILHRLEDIERQ